MHRVREQGLLTCSPLSEQVRVYFGRKERETSMSVSRHTEARIIGMGLREIEPKEWASPKPEGAARLWVAQRFTAALQAPMESTGFSSGGASAGWLIQACFCSRKSPAFESAKTGAASVRMAFRRTAGPASGAYGSEVASGEQKA